MIETANVSCFLWVKSDGSNRSKLNRQESAEEEAERLDDEEAPELVPVSYSQLTYFIRQPNNTQESLWQCSDCLLFMNNLNSLSSETKQFKSNLCYKAFIN